MALPVFQAVGTAVNGTGAVTVVWPTHIIGDVAILLVQTTNEAVTLSTAAGFVELGSSPQSIGVTLLPLATRLTAYWCRATSTSMTSPVVAASTDHNYARIFTFRGCVETGDPTEATAGGTSVTTTAVSATGVTTTIPDSLIAVMVAHGLDSASAQFSGWTNGTLGTVTERGDGGTTSGNGGGFALTTGTLVVPGASGTTTATLATTSPYAFITVSLKPAALPVFQALGAATVGLTTAWPAHLSGDWALLIAQTANEAPVLGTAAGFVEITHNGTGTAASAGSVRLTAYWCRATSSSMTSPVFNSGTNHILSRIVTFRNVLSVGDAVAAFTSDVDSTGSTSATIPAVTSTANNSLILQMVAHATDEAIGGGTVSAETNASLVSVTEYEDTSTASGTGGGMAVAGGLLTTAGSSGTMAATLGTSSKQARISLALSPAGPASLSAPTPVSLALATLTAALSISLAATQPSLALTGADPTLTFVNYRNVPSEGVLTLASSTPALTIALGASSNSLSLSGQTPGLTSEYLLVVPGATGLTLASYASSLALDYAVPAASLELLSGVPSLSIQLGADFGDVEMTSIVPTLVITTNYVTSGQVDTIVRTAIDTALHEFASRVGKVNALPLGIKDEAAARSIRILEKTINRLLGRQ